MEVLRIKKKNNMMNALERFHIYNETKLDNQIHDKGTVKQNIIFDTIIQRSSGNPLCPTLTLHSHKRVRQLKKKQHGAESTQVFEQSVS